MNHVITAQNLKKAPNILDKHHTAVRWRFFFFENS